MPKNLEFRPCPYCGKSVRSDAVRCHRCQRSFSEAREGESNSSEHGAAPYGGYDSNEDDFDYQEFLESEFGTPPKKRDWKRPVAWLVIVSLMLPVILALVSLIRSF